MYCCCDPPFPSSWVLFVGLWLEYDRQVAVDKAFETMAKEPLMEFGPCDLVVQMPPELDCCHWPTAGKPRLNDFMVMRQAGKRF